MAYNELEQRGTADFPVAFFYIDKTHPRYCMSAHWHSELELIRILEGEFEITLNSKSYKAKKGDVIFVNAETVHHGVPKNCVYECIVFHINFLYNETNACKSFMEQIANGDYIVDEFHNKKNSAFIECVNKIFDAFAVKSEGYKFRVISSFYNFFGLIADRQLYSCSGESKGLIYDKNILKIKKILKFIRENFDKAISLDDMAEKAEMSAKYFGAYFKNMTGKTPFDYLNEYRIEKAARKLLNTDLSVTEIAYTCGFNDLSYFIKTFKKINKTSPGKYRKTNR
ncbi:MAG: AraC family transcriptional regulator [Clostridia bacterium]|nr:AraC family transcriptional regulator [Clostridia bacterium]